MQLQPVDFALILLTLVGVVIAVLGELQERKFQKIIKREKADGTYAWPVRGTPPPGERPTTHPAE